MRQLLKSKWKPGCMIVLFYLINFGLWELIALIISDEWASFAVYAVLFVATVALFRKELSCKWTEWKESQLKNKSFYAALALCLVLDLVLSAALLAAAAQFSLDILPQNNENVKSQFAAIPAFLTAVQTCVFAPVIEEMTFRHSMIGVPGTKLQTMVLCAISVILFDWIHIFRFSEFFYYLMPAIILTAFYAKYKNVWASIMLHSSINILGTIALILDIL